MVSARCGVVRYRHLECVFLLSLDFQDSRLDSLRTHLSQKAQPNPIPSRVGHRTLHCFLGVRHHSHLTHRWSRQRAALRSTPEITTMTSMQTTFSPARCSSSLLR